MSQILNKYTDSTKHTFLLILIALVLIIIVVFTKNINIFQFIAFKCIIIGLIGYSIYIILSNSLPIIKNKNTELLASINNNIKNNIIYNFVLVIFLTILICYVSKISL
jgi:hypothetical protein